MTGLAHKAWQNALPAVGRRPSLYLPLSRRRYGRDLTFGPGTEIVIEGYPRSANTFATNAFLLAQERPVRIAHHLHQPAQVMAAAKAGVPALVLVRDPIDAITSFLVRHPDVSAGLAARNYLNFYETLEPLHHAYVVADFEQVTSDFGSVIRRVNERFGTSFREFPHSDETVDQTFRMIEKHSEAQRGRLDESVVARPSPVRQDLKVNTEAVFVRDVPGDVRDRLKRTYDRYRTRTATTVLTPTTADVDAV